MSNELLVQISDIDSYHSQPSHLDQFQNAPKVPIIRIYGAIKVSNTRVSAYNVLVHIHNVYPYFYIDCPQRDGSKLNDEYLLRLTAYLESAISESYKKKAARSDPEEDPSDSEVEESISQQEEQVSKYISSIAFCKGSQVYGYNVGYRTVLKISFFSPLYKTRLFKLLSSNSIVWGDFTSSKNPNINVYEAHINYYAQFLADFNLYPCAWLKLGGCCFRTPILNPNDLDTEPLKEYLKPRILFNNVLNPTTYPRLSRSLIEIDIHTDQIMNRAEYQQRSAHNDFSEYLGAQTDQKTYLSSLKFTFDDLKFQCGVRGMADTSNVLHEFYSQVFENIGKTDGTDWESNKQHEQSLKYAAKLNNPTTHTSVEAYYTTQIKPKLPNEEIPTTFELVTKTLPLTYYENVPLLNFRDDLIKWSSYDILFEIKISNEPNPTFESTKPVPLPESMDQSENLNANVNENENENVIMEEDEKDEYRLLDEIALEKSPTKRPQSSKIDSPDSQNMSPTLAVQDGDIDIFQTTQRKRKFVADEPESASSEGNTPSQVSDDLLKAPHDVFEMVVPSYLGKRFLVSSLAGHGILDHAYTDPSYHRPEDMHPNPLVFASKVIPVPLISEKSIPEAELNGIGNLHYDASEHKGASGQTLWQYQASPPSKETLASWVTQVCNREKFKFKKFRSQVEPAVTRTKNFKYSLKAQSVVRAPSGFLNLTLLSMELHVNTKNNMKPNPNKDSITFIIFYFDNANEMFESEKQKLLILFNSEEIEPLNKMVERVAQLIDTEIVICESEKQMVEKFVLLLDSFDPDILSGFEVNAQSWGYLCERFQIAYDINLLPRLSRVSLKGNGKFGDVWGYRHTSKIKINGRHMMNVWRMLRDELKLTSYSFENVVFNIFHQSVPKVSNDQVSTWIRSGSFNQLLMAFNYYKIKLDFIMKIIENRELVIRNVESSRLIGVDFYSNYYRGSQFKVESILIRIAKPENTLLNSPSKTQVHNMRALDVVPLIMEPDSSFYKSPLVVLDFQSLYPSIMIAYNYCYSTLLGKLDGFKQNRNTIGYMTHHSLPHGLIDILQKNDGLNISPNGLIFATSKFRKSILSRMLQEILNSRINIKTVASQFKDDKELSKLFNSKQLALKLIANVTYGYTSASFSGRMPNSDIADAIVSTGREILTQSIEMIESSPYNAKVVYGDTDSLFVYFPGRTKEYAFEHGRLLADQVTKAFPDPVKLKFEKVYHPCVLLAKKRYVGNCYESEKQTTPYFEAKGIETIRRDGVPAQSKIVGKSLRILFESKNLSKVKDYVVKQFWKILLNKVNVSDFCFAKVVRHGTYKNERYLPPGAVLAKKNIARDSRSEPQYKERVPYLVTKDSSKERIKDRCVSPEQYVASTNTDNPMELDYEYYITRVLIPPLERIFNLMGVNVKEWYKDLPRSTKSDVSKKGDILKISEIMHSKECAQCGVELESESRLVCQDCKSDELGLVLNFSMVSKDKEVNYYNYDKACSLCSSNFQHIPGAGYKDYCVNGDCEIYFAKQKAHREMIKFHKDHASFNKDLRNLEW